MVSGNLLQQNFLVNSTSRIHDRALPVTSLHAELNVAGSGSRAASTPASWFGARRDAVRHDDHGQHGFVLLNWPATRTSMRIPWSMS